MSTIHTDYGRQPVKIKRLDELFANLPPFDAQIPDVHTKPIQFLQIPHKIENTLFVNYIKTKGGELYRPS